MMKIYMKVLLIMIILMEMDVLNGKTEENIKDNGKIIKRMDLVFISGMKKIRIVNL